MIARAFALALALAIATAGCTNGNGDSDGEGGRGRSSSTSTTAPPRVAFTMTAIADNGTRGPSDASIAGAMRVLDSYVDLAIVTPLRAGSPPGDLSAVFSPDALATLGDPSTRATILEEGLPPATQSVTAEVANTNLSAVSGPDGVVAVISARIDLKVRAVGPGLDIDIVRQGDLVLTPGPQPDSWLIDSFGLRTDRNTRD